MNDRHQQLRLLEALLFASAAPLDEEMLRSHLPEDADLAALVADLTQLYANRGVNLVAVGKKWAFRTAPDLAAQLRKEATVRRKLNRAAVETLAVIAYHQPVTRPEIEEIRGVSLSRGTLDVLLEAGWVKPGRRREGPGRPLTWLTTEAFLDHFGLASIRDLPGIEELKAAGLLDKRPAIAAYGAALGEEQFGQADAEQDSDEAEPEALGLAEFGADGEEEDAGRRRAAVEKNRDEAALEAAGKPRPGRVPLPSREDEA
jgi:segregation and condensation protein B